ncbi:ankyrin-2 ankyrin [Colletotrichum simmondsii]|uniref:Ankyrin-2 ankyrin n=1 Tax=Colletotrichum simmondsii TaxID=703756 RepID=A0A135SJV7_9PEZI|nr:ankyrin-2 ankyrin [Colletotrichum simmondsii]
MEADQLAVSLDGLRAIADATFRLIFSFIKCDNKLTSEIRAVANEIQDIAGLLHRLSLLTSGLEENEDQKDQSLDVNTAPPPLSSCRRTLEQLGGSLRRRKNRSDDDGCEQKRCADVKWPFTRAWTADLLNELGEHKKTISEGLNAGSIDDLLQSLSKGKSVATIRDEDWISEVFTDFLQSSGYFQGIYMVLNTFLRVQKESYIKIQDRYKHLSIQSSFFQEEEFDNWLDKGGSHLLFTAPPGGGRTAFTGALVRETFRRRRARTVVVPIYSEILGTCRWASETDLLGTIVAQIARQNPGAFEVLRRYRRDLSSRRKPRCAINGATMEGLKAVLWQMSTFFEHVLVIVDCSRATEPDTTPTIASLIRTSKQSAPNFSLAMVYQDLETIREPLGDLVTHWNITPSVAILQAFAATEVERRVRTGALRFERGAIKDAAIRKLSVGGDHIFWKIAYQLDHLCTLQFHSEQVEFLEKLPCSLHDTYCLTLEEFQKRTPASRSLILKAIQLMDCSHHELSAQEFCQALSVSGISGLDPEILEYPEVDESEILRQCSPMIKKSLDGNKFVFTHDSIEEFLRNIDPSSSLAAYRITNIETNRLLTTCALRFLTLGHFARLPSLSLSEADFIRTRNERYPFYRFAALTWHKIATRHWEDQELLVEAMALFDPKQTTNFKAWCLEVCRQYRLNGSCNNWRYRKDKGVIKRPASICSETTEVNSSAATWSNKDSGDTTSDIPSHLGSSSSASPPQRKKMSKRSWVAGQTRRLARVLRRGDFTPLHMAALLGIDAVCVELIRIGENYNRPSKIGTPLQCAIGGTLLIGKHDIPAGKFPLPPWFNRDRPQKSTIELLINAGADCTRDLPSQTYPWNTVGALALKASEWAGNFEIFAVVVRGGAQLHDDIIAVFRSICRDWSKHKHPGAKERIQDILEILNGMVEKKEGESLAYLKAFQKAVSETTDIDIPLPVSQGISDEMLVQQMWKSIDDDNLKAIEDQSQSNTRIKDLLKDDILTNLLDFAVACSAVNCLDHLLTNYMAENGPHNWKSKAVLYCVEDGKQEVLLCLLKNGAQTMRANARGSTIWHLAAAKATSSGILKILLENSYEAERKDALRLLNESGRTVLAKALVSKQYSNASMILKYCGKDRACLKIRHPSLPHLVAGIEDSVLLKELHDCEMFEFVAKDTPLNYFHIEDSVGVEATRQLLEIFPYHCYDQPSTPLRIYLSRSDLNIYKKEVVTLLVQKELSAAPIVNGIHTWQYFCKSVQGYFRRASEAEAWEVVELVKLMVHLGCMDAYEKARETSGLAEIVSLFDVELMPRAFTPDNDAVLATEEIFGIVYDTTTLPQYYKSSGMDIKVIKWTIAHNSWHLFRRLIHTDIDVHKRDKRANLLEYVCSHGTEFNGHRMLANLLERAEKDRLNELNPDENLGLLHLLGMPYGKEALSSDRSPLFKPNFIPMETFSQPPSSPCPTRLGPGGFAALRIPRDNPKFSILQRLLDEHMDCQLLSKRGNFSALSTHIRYCYLDTARLLLLRGSPEILSTSDKFGWTPVAWACAHGYTNIIDQMVASSCSESIWDFQVEVRLGIEAAPSFTKPYRGLCALHLAVLASVKTVSFLLNHGFASDLDITDAQLHTPLHFATMFGQLETIKELVSRGSNINAKDYDGWTPLHFAINLEKKDTVELLLELGAAHMETKKGETPLDFAMPKEEYYIKRVKSSIQQNLKTGADIHCDKQWLSSLSQAMEKAIIDGDTKTCKKLLAEGCPVDIKMRSCHTCTALIFALSRNEVSANIVDTLVEHGASFRGTTCARHTCGNFKRYGIRHFSDHTSDNSSSSSSSSSSDSDDNKKYRQYAWPSFGSTSLDMLMWEDDLFEKITTWLCTVPEEDMIWLIDNSIAVHVAVDRGSPKALQVLLSHAAKIGDGCHRNLAYELVNRTGWHSGAYVASPLQDAVDACNLELVRLLLEYGAEVDKKTTFKGTALHQAANQESIELAQILLEHGASLVSRDYNRGFTPLEEAVQSGNTEMVNLFLDRGASVRYPQYADTSLVCDSTETAVLMLKSGIPLQTIGRYGGPLWAPACLKIRLATFIFNSDYGHEIASDVNAPKLWKILSYAYYVGKRGRVRGFLRLLCRRSGHGSIRDMTESDGKDSERSYGVLCLFADLGLVEEAQLLLDLGCDIEFEGASTGTALMAAAHGGRLDVVKMLVYAGARIWYEKDGLGRSAIVAAQDFPEITNRDKTVKPWEFIKMGSILSKTAPKAPATVATDTIIPMNPNDDTALNRGIVMGFMMRFDNVLDPERLHSSLTKLLGREGWRKLGARLRLNQSQKKLEYHVPELYNSERPAIAYSHQRHDCSIKHDPLASRLPKATSRPAVIGTPPEKFQDLMRRSDGPKSMQDYIYRDEPQLSLHIVSFDDATLVSLTWLHTLWDGIGRQELLTAWTAILEGRDDDVKTFHGFDTDPLTELGTNPTEPFVLADQRLSVWGLARIVLGYVWDILRHPFEESRIACIPAAYIETLKKKVNQELSEQSAGPEKLFASEGDIVTALIGRLWSQHLPANTNKPIVLGNVINIRPALAQDILPEKTAFISNATSLILTTITAEDLWTKPLSYTAAAVRQSIQEQGTREQIEARKALEKKHSAAFFGDKKMHQILLSNWGKAKFFETDFSSAVVEPHLASVAQPHKLGSPSLILNANYVSGFPLRFAGPIIGKDLDGNIWWGGTLRTGLWDRIAQTLEGQSWYSVTQ